MNSMDPLCMRLAAAETDPVRKDLFLQLSQAETEHAKLWSKKHAAAGVDARQFAPSFRTRVLARLAQRFGPQFMLPAIAATEFADRDKYVRQKRPSSRRKSAGTRR
jgi:vacuolar iron transporter family protein